METTTLNELVQQSTAAQKVLEQGIEALKKSGKKLEELAPSADAYNLFKTRFVNVLMLYDARFHEQIKNDDRLKSPETAVEVFEEILLYAFSEKRCKDYAIADLQTQVDDLSGEVDAYKASFERVIASLEQTNEEMLAKMREIEIDD